MVNPSRYPWKKLKPPPRLEEGVVVPCVNRKGGVGKSSTACNAGVGFSAIGPVTFVDLDPENHDTLKFCEASGMRVHRLKKIHRLEDGTPMVDREEVFEAIYELKQQGQIVVLDAPPILSGPTDMACMMADMLLIPTRPGWNDLGGLRRIFELVDKVRAIENANLPVYTICNFYRNTDEANALVESLQEMTKATFVGKIWERTAYSEALAQGKSAAQYDPKGPSGQEMGAVCDYLTDQLYRIIHGISLYLPYQIIDGIPVVEDESPRKPASSRRRA